MKPLALATLLLFATPAVAEVPFATVINGAIEGYFRPAYGQLAEEAGSLEINLDGLCETPSEATLETARNQFRSVVVAFSRIEFVELGPILEENRKERLLFWPDRRGISLRQVQEILATEDETATDLETLLGKSVGVQGLTALDFVLFGTGSETLASGEGDFRCRYGAAVSEAVLGVAQDLAEAWADDNGIAAQLRNPGAPGNPYRAEAEVLETLVGTIAHGVEAIRDTRLLPVLGREGGQPNPRLAPFWRSAMTIPALRADFAGLSDLFTASQLGKATDYAAININSAAAFARALETVDTIDLPIEEAVQDETQAEALALLVRTTSALQSLIGQNLPMALGLSVGFSSSDGD